MLVTENKVTYLRTGDSNIRYVAALINCPTQYTLYSIDVVTQIDYSTDPGINIYAFDNPKAAIKFIEDNGIDSSFTWPLEEERVAQAPGYSNLFPESSIICAGTAVFPDNWTYPAPIGIKGGSTFSEHGKSFLTKTAKGSYSGALCQGFITVVVTVPSSASFPTTGNGKTYDDATHYVCKCNDCGYVGLDFETRSDYDAQTDADSTKYVCPKCGGNYKCTTCDYEGITATCPHCETISPIKTPNTEECYELSDLIAINVQFEAHE